ncbi:MAG: ATP-binding protein [Cyclobacteriaceae bacterium]|nr:ATP-binding protein [Cyclobacteriaceae bacterium]
MIPRIAADTLRSLARQFRAVAIVGPRQSGKSTLTRTVFPEKPYVSLENPDVQQRVLDDPVGFLHHYKTGVILDEAQRVPELFNYLQTVLDEDPGRGRFILTGSNNFLMVEKVSQSLAGRIGYLDLLPFSMKEIQFIPHYPKDINHLLFLGGYPPVAFEQIEPRYWFPAYVRTYVERDVRLIKNITDLNTFQRFLLLCAGRIGQQVNLSNLAVECGIDHKTVQSWLSVLQASYIVYLLPPYFRNYSKRIIKSPKLYFYDTALACYLLSIESANTLTNHAMRGALFENYIISELLKVRFNAGLRSNLFYWRDVSGHELDVIIDNAPNPTVLEIKSGMTVSDESFKALRFWSKINPGSERYLIYAGQESYTTPTARVLSWEDLHTVFSK